MNAVNNLHEDRCNIYAQFIKSLLSPLEPFMQDTSISEVMVNSSQGVFIEQGGVIEHVSNERFSSRRLDAFAKNHAEQVGSQISALDSSYSGVLPCGSRFHLIWPPATSDGAHHLTVRKHNFHALTLQDLKWSMFDDEAHFDTLLRHVDEKSNIIVSGETGVGKTTLLNAILDRIPQRQRVVVIEEIPEINMSHHTNKAMLTSVAEDMHGEGGKSIRDLVRESLIMRPDRIILGECRGTEAIDMVHAMQTHRGCLATVHGRNIDSAIYRLETLLLLGQSNYSPEVSRREIASSVDLFIQLHRDKVGRRFVSEIREVELD